jgi:subtilisin family serine protease
VTFSKDFTGEGRTDDLHGHGSHVATAAAGNEIIGKGKYTGSAPNANLINLRVLNSKGTGSVSSVLGALDWIKTNHKTYNIRVVNLSLGMPAIDSYKVDPVCRAVRQLVDAGIVVVAAAGNNGKDSSGNKVYGRIHCPGNEPSAITVGASNTVDTIDRSDDLVASYSSRGPTRSFWTDLSGVKHYDNLIKPDIVAPGNKIVAAEAVKNLLVTQHPELDENVSKDVTRKMMRLNGTSMAAPVIAGAAALLFQVNPNLTPNMVKAILMYTAQPLAGFNLFEQGTGQINIEGAVQLAKLVRTDLTATTALGESLLTSAPPTPQTSITYTETKTVTDPLTLLTSTVTYTATTAFPWSQGIILNQTYASGINLITLYQKIYGTGTLLGDGTLLRNGVIVGDTTMLSSDVVVGNNILTSNGVMISDGTYFCSTGVLLNDGVMLSDGVMIGDGVSAGDGVMLSDSTAQAQSVMINGDPDSSPKSR